jgi:hypothetical protein
MRQQLTVNRLRDLFHPRRVAGEHYCSPAPSERHVNLSVYAAQASLKAPRGARWGGTAPPARYWSGAGGRQTPETAPAASCRHLLCLPSQWFRRSRAETPEGSQPAFAWGHLARRLNPYPPDYRTAFASSLILYPPSHRHPLAVGLPRGEDDGLTTFRGGITDGVGSACSPVARQRRQGKGDTPAPGHVPFGSSLSAPLACWFSRRLSAVHLS